MDIRAVCSRKRGRARSEEAVTAEPSECATNFEGAKKFVAMKEKTRIGLGGASGYLGAKVKKTMEENPEVEVFIVDRTTHPEYAARYCDAIYNAAGYVGRPNVDACEESDVEVDLYEANVTLVCRLRDACDKFDIPILHVSSGCIFQGVPPTGEIPQTEETPTRGWREVDVPNFEGSRYVKSKLRGEDALRWYDKKLILRPRMPFCSLPNERNLLFKFKDFTKIVNAWNSISDADQFAKQSCKALVYACKGMIPFGIYNLCHDIPIRNDRILEILQGAGLAGMTSKRHVSPEQFNQDMRAQRSFTVLDSSKAKEHGFSLSQDVEKNIQVQAGKLASKL